MSTALPYKTSLEREHLPEKYSIVLSEIGHKKKILDLGCYNGLFARYLEEQNNYVIGIDSNADAVNRASEVCQAAYVIDLNHPEALEQALPGKSFDYILALDLLEHLIDPAALLVEATKFLKPDGRLLITLPNIAFWGMRKMLLSGQFNYSEVGILDKTHLRFFTFHSALKLIDAADLQLDEWKPLAFQVPLAGRLNLRKIFGLKHILLKIEFGLARIFPNLFCAQFYFKTKARQGMVHK